MLFNQSNMRIVHWDYDDTLKVAQYMVTPKMKAGCMKNRDTNKSTGIYFRWTYLLESDKKVVLHCVAEDSYKVISPDEFTLQDLKLLARKSFENFERVLLERLDLISMDVIEPSFEIYDNSWLPLLEDLKR